MWLLLLSVLMGRVSGGSVSLDLPFQSHSFEQLQSSHLCVSLMTRNGRVGCGTSENEDGGMEGILYHHELVSSSVLSENEAYVLLLPDTELTLSKIQQYTSLLKSQLQGFLVVNSTSIADTSSTNTSPGAQVLPNEDSGYTWNPTGDGLLQQNFHGIPMAFVNDPDIINYLLQVSKEPSLPAIVVGWTLYMGPSTATSTSCLTWKDASTQTWSPKCLPLGGNSVWSSTTTSSSSSSSGKPVILLTTNMDATSMFHEVSPGANMAASNLLTLLLVAKLLSTKIDGTSTYDIAIALFQGESYGQVGSQRFFSEVQSFTCLNLVNHQDREACLYPLRPDLSFTELQNNIAAVMAVDQIAITSDNTFYVHSTNNNNNNNNNGISKFLSNVFLELSTDSFTVQSATNQGNVPPSSLQAYAGDGVVLAGYDATFQDYALYQSHRDNIYDRPVDVQAITDAAIIVARSIIATLYSTEDAETSATYAKNIISSTLSTDDSEYVQSLTHCLFENGNCDFLLKYANMERSTMTQETNFDMGLGALLNQPPSYYVSVYDSYNGQPYAYINQKSYGTYTGDEFGKSKTDTILHRPSVLEMGLYGLLNDSLGRPSATTELKSCQRTTDCKDVTYCSTEKKTVCSGSQVCVCSVAHYHVALDLGLEPTLDEVPGKFTLSEKYTSTPLHTEPYWSSNVGVHVYRKANSAPGLWTLMTGIMTLALGIATSFQIKKYLTLYKLY